MNPLRIGYIVEQWRRIQPKAADLTDVRVMDVGCGGGLLALVESDVVCADGRASRWRVCGHECWAWMRVEKIYRLHG